jgi:hypothetical protein
LGLCKSVGRNLPVLGVDLATGFFHRRFASITTVISRTDTRNAANRGYDDG